MSEEPRRDLQVHIAPDAAAPAVARLTWMMEDTRRLTLETLETMPADWVDWMPPVGENVGTILYHLAVIEADWLVEEILVTSFPPALASLFPHRIRDDAGNLQSVLGESLQTHMERLSAVRAALLETLAQMDEADLRLARVLAPYDVTPEWVLHHLIQHEAEHRGQIGTILGWAHAAHTVGA